MVVSTVNWLAMLGYTLLLLALNAIVYFAAHGGPPARHALDARAADSVGLYPFPVPWEIFALGGLVMLVIAVLTRSRARRVELPLARRASLLQTAPGFLATIGFFAAGVMVGTVGNYSGLLTVFDPYLIGPVLALAAGIVSLRRWQLDAPAPPRTRSPQAAPSRLAETLGVVLVVDFLAILILGYGGVALNQLVYLTSHGGALPPGSARLYNAGTDIWEGHMPLGLPWWLFALLSVVLLAVSVLSWPSENRFGPQLHRRVFFRRTTAPALFAFGLVAFVAEATVDLYYGSGRASDPAFLGPAIALVVVLVALARWFVDPAIRRLTRPKHPQKRKTVSPHG
jgi:hypothetical protein